MATSNVWMLIPSVAVLYIVGILIYRLYIHPLAKFPGPKLAAATGWYETYHDLKNPGGQLMYKLHELHRTYGNGNYNRASYRRLSESLRSHSTNQPSRSPRQ